MVISTDALAEAKEALANVGNAEILRKENQELFQENRKLKSDLESAQKLLESTLSKAKEQAEKDAESVRLLQDTLEARLAEMKAVDDQLLSKKLLSSLVFILTVFFFLT